MEPIHRLATHPHPPDPPTAPPVPLPLALLAIFVLECLIALHTLWPNCPSYVALLTLWERRGTLGQMGAVEARGAWPAPCESPA
jgi:hypothetical protein